MLTWKLAETKSYFRGSRCDRELFGFFFISTDLIHKKRNRAAKEPLNADICSLMIPLSTLKKYSKWNRGSYLLKVGK